MESSASSDALTFDYDLRPVLDRLVRTLGIGSIVVHAAVLLPMLAGTPVALGGEVVLLANLAVLGIVFALVLVRGWHRGRAARVIVSAGGVLLPSLWHAGGHRRVALADIRRIVTVPIDGRPMLYMAVVRHLAVVLPLQGFASRDDAARFLDALAFRSRIRPEPIAADHGTSRYAIALVAVLFLVHVLRELLGHVDIAALLHWGALNRTLVFDGEWYRLFTYSLLQPDVLALTLHGLAFVLLVPALQRALGSAGVSLVLVVGAIGGGIGALSWVDGSLALGMDGALYGLIGAVAWTRFSMPARISPTLWRLPAWLWVGWIMVDLLLAVVGAGIALPLRLLGLFSGAACAGLLELAERRARGLSAWLGVSAVALALVACSMALVDRLTSASGDALALELVRSESASLGDANVGAWLLASAPSADTTELEAARASLAARLAPVPDADPDIRDTLATLHYRLGDHAQALAIEAQLQREAPSAVFATQLARFARAAGAAAREGDALVERSEDRVCVVSPSQQLLDVDVLLYDDVRLVGILQFERLAERACARPPATLPAQVRAELGRVSPSLRAGTGRVSYWRADAGMLALP